MQVFTIYILDRNKLYTEKKVYNAQTGRLYNTQIGKISNNLTGRLRKSTYEISGKQI